MRKLFKLTAVLLIMSLAFFNLTSYAVSPDDTFYCSGEEVLNDSEAEDLKEQIEAFETNTGYKFRCFIVDSEEESGLGKESFDGYDGMVAIFDHETGETSLSAYGEAAGYFDGELLDYITDACIGYYDEYGAWGLMYGYIKLCESFITEGNGSETAAVTEIAAVTETEAVSESNAGASAPYTSRVVDSSVKIVDDADIFTSAEEAELSGLINRVIEETDKDIVIVTNMSDDGKGKRIWAADFYDWNGYGTGADHEGMCLYIDMDPEARGWWAMQTGPVSRKLYTEDIANTMDDALYPYMKSGKYADGINTWVNCVRTLYKKGIPFAPEWYPDIDRQSEFSVTGSGAYKKVDDAAERLTEEQTAALESRIAELSSLYKTDIVIHLCSSDYNLGRQAYSEMYYRFNNVGYGTGDENSGILITLWPVSEDANIVAKGSAAEKLTDVNEDRIEEKCAAVLSESGKEYDAAMSFLNDFDHMQRTGRVALSLKAWLLALTGGGIFGSIFGGISLSSAKRKMKANIKAAGANLYLKGESLRVQRTGGITDRFLNTVTRRSYNPVTSSGGSSSGGGSSYSGSYSGSSGTSHSGSGRSF